MVPIETRAGNAEARPLGRGRVDFAALKPASVLLAEDDEEIRALVAAELRKDGYEVIEAQDGQRLRNLIRAMIHYDAPFGRPRIIITDLRMPGGSGLDALEELRQKDWLTPVILITAFGDAETVARALRLGVAAVFDKPFDLEDLRIAVLRLVRPPSGPLEG